MRVTLRIKSVESRGEVVRILRYLADNVSNGFDEFIIVDSKGTHVGGFKLTDEVELPIKVNPPVRTQSYDGK